ESERTAELRRLAPANEPAWDQCLPERRQLVPWRTGIMSNNGPRAVCYAVQLMNHPVRIDRLFVRSQFWHPLGEPGILVRLDFSRGRAVLAATLPAEFFFELLQHQLRVAQDGMVAGHVLVDVTHVVRCMYHDLAGWDRCRKVGGREAAADSQNDVRALEVV